MSTCYMKMGCLNEYGHEDPGGAMKSERPMEKLKPFNNQSQHCFFWGDLISQVLCVRFKGIELILIFLLLCCFSSECPEECKAAVASLMFAAARFSDLPELRDLRHMFYERYGDTLQVFENKEVISY